MSTSAAELPLPEAQRAVLAEVGLVGVVLVRRADRQVVTAVDRSAALLALEKVVVDRGGQGR